MNLSHAHQRVKQWKRLVGISALLLASFVPVRAQAVQIADNW